MQTRQQHSALPHIWRSISILFSLALLSQTVLADDLQVSMPEGGGKQVKNMLQLVQPNGKSNYEIVADPKGPQAALEGAKELQRLLRVATGIELPVVKVATPSRHQIVIGAHPLASAAGVTATGLGADGFRMRTIDGNLYLVGEDIDRGEFFQFNNCESSHGGSYFAVIEFATRFLGVRWYMPGPLGEEAPHHDQIVVPADLNLMVQPRFAIRSLNITFGGTLASRLEFDHSYMKKLQYAGKIDGDYFDAPSRVEAVRWGRHLRLGETFSLTTSHAWFQWVPAENPNTWSPKAYGKDHPEYFALRNGQRAIHYNDDYHGGQLCVSNPEVARIYAENIIAYAKRTGERAFSLSCNDGGEQCECEHCRAWDVVGNDANGEPNHSDRLARFANAVAEQVVAAVPDVTLGLYAYTTSVMPPRRIKLHPSIVVSDVHNRIPDFFYSPQPRQGLESDLRGWRTQTKRVVLTSYYMEEGFWSLPFSTLDAQGWLIKLLAEYPSSAGVRMCYTYVGDLPPMGMLGADPWVIGQLLWNPDQSVTELTHEFYMGAFGKKAGKLLEEYFDTINCSLAKAYAQHPGLGRNSDGVLAGPNLVISVYTPIREKCHTLIQQAVAAVASSDKRYQWRVDRIARGWKLAELTLDAIAAASDARQTTGSGRSATWEKAINIGRERQALATAPDSRFSLAMYSRDCMDKYLPLGVVSELPGGENLRLAVPTVKDIFVMDGQLDKPVWKQATLSSSFKENKKGGTPIAPTQVRIFSNTSGLSIGFQCREPQMAKLCVVDDPAKLWSGDVVEVFLMPTGRLDSYVQFSVNPNGIGKAIIKRGDLGTDMNWQPEWKYVAHKAADSWSVEILIPWASLGLKTPPPAGTTWYADFFRERWTGQSEFSGWSPTISPFFANPTKFGRIQFASSNN